MRYWYEGKHYTDINAVIQHMDKREFKSPTQSTIPLISWLKHEKENEIENYE